MVDRIEDKMDILLRIEKDALTRETTQYILRDGKLIQRKQKLGHPYIEANLENPEKLAKEEKAIQNLKATEGWKDWSIEFATNYIDKNVTDLQSAKNVLKEMAKMIIILRDKSFFDIPKEGG